MSEELKEYIIRPVLDEEPDYVSATTLAAWRNSETRDALLTAAQAIRIDIYGQEIEFINDGSGYLVPDNDYRHCSFLLIRTTASGKCAIEELASVASIEPYDARVHILTPAPEVTPV